jgi:PAS domain S-box-containing protein
VKPLDLLRYKPFIDAGIDIRLKECIKTGRKSVSEHVFRQRGEKSIYISLTLVPVKGKGKKTAGIWLAIDDTTGTRHVEDALRMAEHLSNSVMEASMEGITIVQDGLYKYVNPALSQMMKVKSEELIGRSYLTYVDPESSKMVVKRYQDRLEGKDVPNPFEVKVKNGAGEERYIEYTGSFIRYDGKPADLLFVRDITERKRMEEQLKDERKKAQNYLDTAEVMILVLDTEGRVLLINRKGRQVLGYRENEMTGKSWFDFFCLNGYGNQPGLCSGSIYREKKRSENVFPAMPLPPTVRKKPSTGTTPY